MKTIKRKKEKGIGWRAKPLICFGLPNEECMFEECLYRTSAEEEEEEGKGGGAAAKEEWGGEM